MRHLPRNLFSLSQKIRQPDLPWLACQFLFTALNPDTPILTDASDLPEITGKINVYNSAHVVFHAPSDFSGLRGMHHEWIRSVASWHSGRPRRDCVFIGNSDSPDAPGFKSLLVARVYLFFSFKHENMTMSRTCAPSFTGFPQLVMPQMTKAPCGSSSLITCQVTSHFLKLFT